MPKGKGYTPKSMNKKGNTRTPADVMGSQGKPVRIVPEHYKSRPTKTVTFEEGTAPRPGAKASGRHNPPNHGKY